MEISYEEIKAQASKACQELVETAKLKKGDILAVGCSSSEFMGQRIGTSMRQKPIMMELWSFWRQREYILLPSAANILTGL